MRRLLELRIVRPEFKLLYAIGVWLSGFPIMWLLGALRVPDIVLAVMSFAVTFAGVLLGARIFRGRGEPLQPARPWWRMTAWPRLSLVVGTLSAIGAALSVGATVVAALDPEGAQRVPGHIETTILYAVLAFLYLNSAVRMRRAGIAKPEPEFRPRAQRLQ